MCGICGIVNLNMDGDPPEKDLLIRMMGRLRHRGPDSSGYYRDRKVALGHTRLAIIDLQGGAQPLSNEDGSIWITFNGEIFNYVELSAELSKLGHFLKPKVTLRQLYMLTSSGEFLALNGLTGSGRLPFGIVETTVLFYHGIALELGLFTTPNQKTGCCFPQRQRLCLPIKMLNGKLIRLVLPR